MTLFSKNPNKISRFYIKDLFQQVQTITRYILMSWNVVVWNCGLCSILSVEWHKMTLSWRNTHTALIHVYIIYNPHSYSFAMILKYLVQYKKGISLSNNNKFKTSFVSKSYFCLAVFSLCFYYTWNTLGSLIMWLGIPSGIYYSGIYVSCNFK